MDPTPSVRGHLDALRERTLTVLYGIVLPLGSIGNVSAHLRNARLEVPVAAVWATWMVSGFLVLLAVMIGLRRLIPFPYRAWLFVGTLHVATSLSVLSMGVVAPTGYIAPACAALAWFLLGPLAGFGFAFFDLVVFATAMWLHTSGRITIAEAVSFDRSPSHWVIAAAAQSLICLFSILVAHRLLQGAVERQEELARHAAELESRVARRTHSLEKAREEMQDFAYAVSHDLRAPLRAIDGFARVVIEDERGRLSREGEAALERIVAGTARMGRLIDAMLGLSRLDRAPLRRNRVAMEPLVRQVVEELEAGVQGGRVVWEIEALPAAETDPDLIRQVWQNLLTNAAKFSAGTAAPRVQVGSEWRDDGIWYVVRDNGSGFDMAYAAKLFGMFQRLHDGKTEGLGIGLAIVKRILDRLEGAIEADGAPGQGAIFRFRAGAPRPPVPPRLAPDARKV